MKGKKLIVIMAIVILMFTIQASCALENDNDFNLTQTTDVNTVNNQIVDDNVITNQVNDVKKELNDSADITKNVSVSSKSSVLGASNENNVLGRDWTPPDNSMRALISILTNGNLKDGDNVFLNGWTYSGPFNYFTISKSINIYGGNSTDSSMKATLDLSQFILPPATSQHKNKARFNFQYTCKITGVNFVNYYATSDIIDPNAIIPERGHLINLNAPSSFYNCTFENNTVYQKSYIINCVGSGNGATIENCKFYNNTASVIVYIGNGLTDFKANNNVFKNNKGTINLEAQANSNSLGLCFKVVSDGSTFDNNTFINNTNAVHGSAYCVNAKYVVISNNHIENNSASYGAGIECHYGSMKVYNTTFIGNKAYGGNSWHKDRNGTGGAIAFIGPNNYIYNCTFINNSAENFGGALDIHTRGTEKADYTTVVNSRLENNFAENKYGGAIFIQGQYANITNCTLTNNSAPTGGAIQIVGFNASIYDSNFVENNAIQGGAVYIEGHEATVVNSTFTNNTATHNLGSKISDNSSKVTSGGAMYVESNNVNVFDTSFESNVAEGNYSTTGFTTGFGGALYLLGQNPAFVNVNFTKNDATLGGGVYIEGNNVDASNINLYNNTAVQGGAVYIAGNDITLDKITAKENNAIQGGAIYIQGQNTEVYNSTFEDNLVTREIDLIKPGAENLWTMGGGIYINGNNVVVPGNNTFRRNTASGSINGGLGGAIAIEGGNTTIYDGQFTLNEAVRGGAIYVDGANATVKDMYFTTNNAVQGGSIFINGVNTNITGNTFYDNNATHSLSFNSSSVINLTTKGGAIAVKGDYSTITYNNFTYNAAIGANPTGGLGGAIAIDGYHTNITDNIFNDNEAIRGGALYINGTNTTIYNANFTYNRAIKGGAAYVNGVNTTVVNSQFKYNNATHNLTYNLNPIFDSVPAEGGAIDIVGNNTLLDNLLFSENNAIGVNPDGGLGGAVAVNGYDTKITDVSFDLNQAIKGGAVYVNGVLNSLNYTNFTSNSAIQGGAVFINAFNTTILGCELDNNTATHDLRFSVSTELDKLTTFGGGVAIQGDDVNIINSTFTNNTAVAKYEKGGLGGAVAVNGSDNFIFNSSFKDNEAIKGGAFYFEGGSTLIDESNFTDNHAIKGGSGYIAGENTVIKNSLFENNNATHDLKYDLPDVLKNSKTAGGAIYIVGHDINVTSSNFTDNHANAKYGNTSIGGGAFYIEGNNVNISDSTFDDNTAVKGGAVYIAGNVTNIFDSNFTHNSVTNLTVMEGLGGAVFLENSHDGEFARCNFENNSASVNGGAIDWHEGATKGRILNCTFTNNTADANGGAVYWYGTNGTISGSNFTDNRALGIVNGTYGRSGEGGAVVWTGSNGLVDDCIFVNNAAAKNGGAVYLDNINEDKCDNTTFSNSRFENNSAAVNGGAIDWHDGATNGAIVDSSFVNNSAKANGGAVYWFGTNGTIEGSNFTDNRALGTATGPYGESGCGGAVIWTGSNGLVDDCNFINNSAVKNGGAVYLRNLTAGGCDNTTFSNSHFENNTAGINGGAIDWHDGATNGAIVDSSFVNNSAKANGGAVFWYGTNGTINGTNFTDNRALGTATGTYGRSGEGGAVIWTGSNGLVDDCIFVNNAAAKNGGAVYLDNIKEGECDNTTFSNSRFENNSAAVNGGAIDWHDGATNGAIVDSSFVNNSAKANGGAVYWFGTNGTIEGSNFTDNRALGTATGPYGESGCGGAVIWTGSNGLVDDCNFINNSAVKNGGAVYLRNLTAGGCDNTTFSNSHFENNTAGINGGAIDWHDGATNGRIEDSSFVNNSAKANGGAVYWFGTNGTIEGSNFTDNRALGTATGTYGESGCGGAVIWTGSNGLVDDCIFVNNAAAKNGGAVYLDNIKEGECDNTTFSNSRFENNSAAVNGGAIDWHDGATNGAIVDSSFVNNSAKANGGAVYWFGTNGTIEGSNFTDNRALGTATGPYGESGCGGAVIWTGSNGLVDDCNFINNSAVKNGGAVYLRNLTAGGCDNTTFSNSHFENNTAGINGGAIDWHDGATNGRIEDSSFVNNSAKANGGAVYWFGTSGTIEGSNFTDNRALGTATGPYGESGCGGAVIWTGSNGLVDDCNFINNSAVKNGGAVYLRNLTAGGCNDTTFSNSHFENNTAGANGGAIDWHQGATNGRIENSTFENNTANRAGGAVYWNGETGAIIGSNFTNNRATGLNKTAAGKGGDGGAVIWRGSNGLVDECLFENNTAARNGGAVYLEASDLGTCDNTTFKNSKFINNNASEQGGAIDWDEGATNGAIINSTFEKNNATDGGAVSWFGHNGKIIDSNFTDNHASRNGGAVLWSGINGVIDNTRFVNNTAENGGAVYLQNCTHGTDTNMTIKDSYFENNSAVYDGGALNWHKGTNATVDNTEFVDNYATRGGAVFINGTDGTIKNSNFTANEAILGGAVYANNEGLTITDSNFDENAAIQGGAAFMNAVDNYIKYSNFTLNNATYTLRKVNTTGNNNKTKGGAVYIADEDNVIENSKFYNNTASTNRPYNNKGNDPSSSDDGFGGAIFVGANKSNITSSEFNDNKACNGSAIYNDAENTLLKDDTFIKNQAWSYKLDVNATPKVNHYGDTITIDIANYTGGDNILNGIYNAKFVNSLKFNNVKYIVNDSESNIGTTAQANPVEGAEKSAAGTLLYQDSRERYQKIILEFINNETGKVVRNMTVRTDYLGNNTFNVTGFNPGNYTVKAYHPEDRNYKYIVNLATFEVQPYVDINITKTVDNYYTVIGDNVTFTVTVSNAGNSSNATKIKVKDFIPAAANLIFVDSTATNGTFNQADYSWTIDKLANGTSETLTLVFKTTTLGKFNNTVNVTCAEDEWNYTNNNASCLFEVVIVNLTINKTANVVGNISVMEDVTFTINVTNNAKVNATKLVVTDIVPTGFKYVKTNDTNYNSKTGLLNIDVLKPGESYLFTVTLKAITNGTLTNYVNVTCKENITVKKANASVNVTPVVNLTVTKVTDFNDYVVGDNVTFTIIVTNNGPSNATNINVTDIFDKGGLELLPGYKLNHTIPFLASGASEKIIIKTNVTQIGNWTNRVNVTCDQNKTIKSANVTVRVYNVDLRINKTANVTSVPVNGLINFTITVKNHSNDYNATFVSITDSIDTGVFEFISTNGTKRLGNLIMWAESELLPNQTVSIWVVVRAKTNGTFTNTAQVSCKEEGTLQNSTATVHVYPVVKLEVNKTSNVKTGENVTVSNNVVFTVNVTNKGISNATGVRINDVVPAGFEFVESSDSGYNSTTGVLTVGLIKPGESHVFTITLKVIANGTLTNTVNVTCNENKTLKNSSASINAIPVILTVNKTANVTLVANNTLVKFTIVVNNTGIANATQINVTDILPDGFEFVSVSAGNVTDGQKVTWIIDKLNGGKSTELWVIARSKAVGINWTNVVDVYCKENKTVVSDQFNVTVAYTNLTVVKTANVTVVGNNTLVNFTIVVNNTGIVNATNVTVADMLPSGFVFVSASSGNVTDGQKVSWIIDRLNIGDVREFWIVARSNATGNWTNVVEVNSTENVTVVDSNVTIDVRPVNLTVVKTANVTVVGNNTLVNFTIVVNNTGVMNATNVTVADMLPSGFVFVSASSGNVTDGQKVSWIIDRLNIGDVREFWIVARSNATGNWTNVVEVNSTENVTVVDSNVTIDVRPVNLTVVKTANVTVVGNNTLVNFTIVVNNTGVMNATNVTVADMLPSGFVFVSASSGNVTDGQKVSWIIDRLNIGDVREFWIVARSNATGNWTNVVEVNSTENVTVVDSNVTIDVRPVNLTVVKTANVTVVGNNTLVNFTIVVNNTGVMNATNITVKDVLPGEFAFVNATAGYTRNGQLVSWTIDKLDVNGVETFWIIAKTIATNATTNVVNVTSNENKTNSTGKFDVNVVEVNATLTKEANVTKVGNNTLVEFKIVLNHTSIINATNVTVCDSLPDGFAFVNATGVYTRNGQEIKWYFDTLKPGQIVELWITARSNATGKWNNTVSVSCNENDTIITTNATVDVLPVTANITKEANVTVVGNNTLVNFTISVNYTCDVNATNVTIKDVLPDGFTFVGASDNYKQTGQVVEWYFDKLTKGEYKLWIIAKSNAVGKWNNTVTASCNENDTIIGDNAAVDVIPVNASITKKANITLIGNNTLVNFTIGVNYTANVNATNVTICDVLPDGFAFVNATGVYTRNGQEIKWHFDTLTKGYFELEIVARSNATGKWTNVVTAVCNENATLISANDTVEVAPVNITVIKEVSAKTIDVLGLVNFTITITNNGKVNATNVSIADIMDLSVFNITNHNGTYVQKGNEIVWNIGSLNVGETYKVWIEAKALTNGTFTNIVNVASLENETAGSDNVSVKVTPVVNLTVVKTVNVGKISLNDYVTFTINVTNNGPSNATNVVIKDVLPSGLNYYDSTGVYDPHDPTIISLVQPGESIVFDIIAECVLTGNWTNNVNVYCDQNDTVKSDNASVEVVSINLTVVKTADKTIVANNSLVNYTISITNPSDFNATNIWVFDYLMDGFEFVNATEGYYLTQGIVSWNIHNITKGETLELWIVVKTTKVGNLTNNVNVICDESNNSTVTNSTVQVVPVNLTVVKTANVNVTEINGEVVFTVNVTNNGPGNATLVNVTDIIPVGFEFVESSDKGYNSTTGRLTIPFIKAGESYVFTITLKAVINGTLTNVVNVTSNENNTVKSGNVSVNVTPVVNLTVIKVVDLNDTTIGDVVTFTITVINNGPSKATNIKVVDSLDLNGFRHLTGDLNTTIDSLASGENCTIVIQAATTANGTYMNRVTVKCDQNDTIKSANASVYVYSTDLKINKTATVTNASVNDVINFTITVKNHGMSNATNVHIIDELNSAFEFVNASAGYKLSGKTVTWNVSRIANETTYSVWIVVRVLTNGTFDNVAHVNCSEESTIKNSTATVNVAPVVNLTVVKTVDVTTVEITDNVVFTVNVTNNGPSDATGVRVVDVVPAGFEFVESSDKGYDSATGLLTVPLIKAGESYVFTITLKAIVDGNLTNVVNVTSNENVTVKSDNVSVYVTPVVNLTVVKVVEGDDDVTIGDVITYTIIVTNNGPSNATNIKVIDIPDKGLKILGDKYETVIRFLESGKSTNITIQVRTTAKGTYMNYVNVTCDQNDTVKSANASVYVYETDMKINKTANVSDVYVGDLVNFTISVKNHGKSNATNVHIIDELESAFEFVNASAGYTRNGQTVTWNVPKLANETSYSVWIVVRVITNGTFDNVAYTNCSEEDTVKNTTSTVNVAPVVNLTVVKSADVSVVDVNGEVVFTVNVTNNGPSNATGVRITDVVPAGFEFVGSNATGYDSATGLLTVPLIEAGESYVFTITLKAVTNGTLTNVVNVTSNENSTAKGGNVSVKVIPVVDLTVVKFVDVSVVDVNGEVVFTVNVTNNGPSNATGVRVVDVVPAGFEFVRSNATGYDSATGLLTVPLIEAGESYVFTITLKAVTNGTLTNVVNVTSNENATVKGGNVSVKVIPVVNLTVVKMVNTDDALVGDNVTFTIIVTNNGPSNATNVTVRDILDNDGFELVSGNLTTIIPVLESGKSEVITIVVKTNKTGTFVNSVEVTCDQNDTVKTSNVSVSSYETDLKINKIANATDVAVNGLVNFTISVKNHGTANATGVHIIDELDSAFEFVDASAGYKLSGNIVTWNVSRIASEDTYSVWIVVRVLTNGTFDNVAHTNCSEESTIKNSTATVKVTPVVNLTVVKFVDVSVVDVNGEVVFTVNVTNNGPSNATGVRVVDVVPAGFEFVKSNATGYDSATGLLTVPLIEAGESYVFTITLKAVTNGTLTNVVNVTSNENATVKGGNVSVKVIPVVNLTVVKMVNTDDALVGDNVTFTIIVTNNGPSNATNVTVRDILDNDGFELVSGNLTTIIPVLESGKSEVITIVVKTIKTGTFMNRVEVTCNQNDTVKTSNVSVSSYETDLKINKIANATDVAANGLVNFTISVKNHGTTNATGVHIIDELDSAFEFVDASAGYKLSGKTITWNVSRIASEDTCYVWIVVRALTNGTFDNVAHVNCSEESTIKNSTATVVVTPVVNLTVVKIADVKISTIGGEITFTITVTNNGPSNATNVVVEDILPSGLQIISGDLNTTIALLESGESKVITIKAKAVSTGNLTNVVSVHSNENATIVESDVTVRVFDPKLSIIKTSGNEYVYSGNQTTFTIKVTNDGDMVLTGVFVEDKIPTGLIYDHFIGTNWTYDGTKFYYDGSLDVGETVELTIVVNTTQSGKFTNEATAGSDQTSTSASNASVIVYTPALTVREISNNPRALVGQEVSFTVVVTNIGDCELTGVYTVNNFPEGLIYKGYDGDMWDKLTSGTLGAPSGGWTQDGNKFSYSGILKPGESANYTLYFTTTAVGIFTPEVIANSDLTSGAYSNNTTVVVEPKLELKQEIDKSTVDVGDKVTIKVTVTNVGGCDLGNVYVIEHFPDGLKYDSFKGKGWTKVGNKFIYSGVLGIGESASFEMVFYATKEGSVINTVVAGSNMTDEISDDVEIEVVNKTKPHPRPHPKPEPRPEPRPEPTPENETVKHKPVSEPATMHATGNPIILLLLTIMAIIPLRRRKH